VTKFATVRAAITGEAFFEAGRNVTDLLMRNFLKAYGAPPAAGTLARRRLSSFAPCPMPDALDPLL
jgi:hypothetical protein